MNTADETATVEQELKAAAAECFSSIWWISLLRGILLAVLGCYALLAPEMTVRAFFQVVAIFEIADGILAVIAGIGGLTQSRGWTIARGALGILAGIIILSAPMLFGALVVITMVFIIAFQCIGGGILEIVVAIKERNAIDGPGWLVLSGIFSILLGIIVMSQPLLTAVWLVRIVGIFAIGFGIAVAVMSFRIKSLANAISDAP